MSRHLRLSTLPVSLALAVALLSGCGSPKGRPDERLPPQPIITAQAYFVDHSLRVDAELGPFRRPRPPSDTGNDEERDDSRPRRPMGGPGGGGPRGAPPAGEGGGGSTGGRPLRGAQVMLRQSLTVTVTNVSATPVELRVAEVRSALGNFVPVPETFTLEPGARQTLEPMRAGYPANLDELELAVRIRTADANDAQTLRLQQPEQP
ncbi:hypothetical protein [Synoicihabitans lomoniglobus]|uniref:Lipoprotein n=1 Tax=Synoicihabitans lomoniglobus TaxID=2909285 RepID=A0AAF0CNT9_9BACT|nr:hypothetical protein [Opitutaceae bacterium LMO-M01]WED65031.1 hypothetical protein PXH66_22000 [Opitutaceae bacterium LMO-M01]